MCWGQTWILKAQAKIEFIILAVVLYYNSLGYVFMNKRQSALDDFMVILSTPHQSWKESNPIVTFMQQIFVPIVC